METYGKRFYERTLHGVHIVGKLETQVGLMGDILLENAVDRRSGEEFDVLAEVVVPVAAMIAVPACLAGLERYTVSDLEMLYILADFYDRTTGFVAEDEWGFYDEIPDPSRLEIMQVGSADAYEFDLYKNLVILWLGDGTLHHFNLADARHEGDFHISFHDWLLLLFCVILDCPWPLSPC